MGTVLLFYLKAVMAIEALIDRCFIVWLYKTGVCAAAKRAFDGRPPFAHLIQGP